MDLKSVLPMLAKLAPSLAMSLGGPLAATAVQALGEVFGLDMTARGVDQQEALVGALKGATQEQLILLKKADQDYAVKMAELGFKNVEALEELIVNDRIDARKRETNVKDNTPRVLAYLLTVGFFGVLTTLMFGHIPEGSKEILYIMLGTLGTAWMGSINYFFGSTNGSVEKSKMLLQSDPTKKV